MKHHILFKFIAVILCAACLLGAIGGIAGIVVLTESDLYNKTVEEVKAQRIAGNAQAYGRELSLMYASAELGGCPEDMINSEFGGSTWFNSTYENYGYRILDAEGNVLSSYNEDLRDKAAVSTHTIQESGQYKHLVSLRSRSEIEAEEAAERAARYTDTSAFDFGDNPEIPAEGIELDAVSLFDIDGNVLYAAECEPSDYYNGEPTQYRYYTYDTDGSSEWYTADNQVGYLFCNQHGELIFLSAEQYVYSSEYQTIPVYSAHFFNYESGFEFELDAAEPIGTLTLGSEYIQFHSLALPEEDAGEPALAEEPGWTIEGISEDGSTLTLIGPGGETIPVSLIPTEPEEPTEPETIPETTAVTVDENGNPIAAASETAPAETVVPTETTVSETIAETVSQETASSASAIPGETSAADATAVTEAAAVTEALENPDPALSAEPIPVETLPPETVPEETLPAETIPVETIPEETEPIVINGKPLEDYQINTRDFYDSQLQESMTAEYVYVPMPELTVELYIDEDALSDAVGYEALTYLRQYRNLLLPLIGGCLLLFAIFAVYLCTAAGRKPKSEEVRAGGLNRMPLDLYLFGGSMAIALCVVYAVELCPILVRQNLMMGASVTAGLFFLASLIFVGFCFAFVAQIKTPGGFWWRNTLCGISIRLFMRFAIWLESFLATKGFPALGRLCKKLWVFTKEAAVWCYHTFEAAVLWLSAKLGGIFRWIGAKLHRWLSLMPLTWQWIICGMVMYVMLLIALDSHNDFMTFLGLAVWFILILYGSHCFGILLESTKRMGRGDLDSKVDDKFLMGSFQEFASDLNDLADVAVVAAQKQLKSERMKTELITNVSHDIKTPLTSIINYVDLLQKPHTEEEGRQYLEVLDRQSQRLKKLIDDLMDMSKASTGNMAVEITTVDAVESVNQALGEFADKLDRAHLIPVFRHDDPQVPMRADGKLVWRVLSNLLGNAVKYAMPGTRLYIDLMALEGKVILSLKNISREELNVDAEELMERFVRGDDSRNTEGSGLGLNIAKSLMELQKGQLQLLVDGDLFKVTLIFPAE